MAGFDSNLPLVANTTDGGLKDMNRGKIIVHSNRIIETKFLLQKRILNVTRVQQGKQSKDGRKNDKRRNQPINSV